MKRIFKITGAFSLFILWSVGLILLDNLVKPVKADNWQSASPDMNAVSDYKRERNEMAIRRDFPKPSTWKIILRERLSKDEVYYLLENSDGKRVDFKPCGLGKNYIVGEKVKVSQKGPMAGADDDFECSLDIYRE